MRSLDSLDVALSPDDRTKLHTQTSVIVDKVMLMSLGSVFNTNEAEPRVGPSGNIDVL